MRRPAWLHRDYAGRLKYFWGRRQGGVVGNKLRERLGPHCLLPLYSLAIFFPVPLLAIRKTAHSLSPASLSLPIHYR